jgi:hypothetical protein
MLATLVRLEGLVNLSQNFPPTTFVVWHPSESTPLSTDASHADTTSAGSPSFMTTKLQSCAGPDIQPSHWKLQIGEAPCSMSGLSLS